MSRWLRARQRITLPLVRNRGSHVNEGRNGGIKRIIIILALATLLLAPTALAGNHKADAKIAAAKYGWTGGEWDALDKIIMPESHWESCMRFPSTFECGYAGGNSCGIPQASPCPSEWRGQLDKTWREQIAWMLNYIKHRYGDPINALAFRWAHNWY